ncbi:hypothetical protein HKD37_12G034358 [Glycine soja]
MLMHIPGSRISSLLCSKAPLVGSYVYDSCWCLRFPAPTSSSIARPWPNFMDWLQMDRCRAAASLPSIKEKQLESHSNCIRHDRENQGLDKGNMAKIDGYQNLFGLMKQRKELEHFQALAEAQFPKVIIDLPSPFGI